MTIPLQPLEFADFAGGITDNYLDAPLNQCERCDNLLVLPNKKLMTRWGSQIYSSTAYQPAANRIGTIIDFNGTLLFHSVRDLYRVSGGVFTSLPGPDAQVFAAASDATSIVTYGTWTGHLLITSDAFGPPVKIYVDGVGALQARTAGLPKITGSVSISTDGAGTHNYLYRYCYFWQYQVGTVTFQAFGPTYSQPAAVNRLSVISGANPASVLTFTSMNVPPSLNYETTGTNRIRLRIYRSTDNGNTFYQCGDVPHDQASFSDTMDDATLQNQVQLYTTGGALDRDPPPPAKFVHCVLDLAYYANIKDVDGALRTNRVRQAVPNTLDACPGSLFDDLEEAITGFSSVVNRPVVFCTNYVYRLDGRFDQAGQGGITHTRISDLAGCVSAQSIVQTQAGLFWFGNDGIYFTDAFQVSKISPHLNKSYQRWTKTALRSARIQGRYDRDNHRICWNIQDSDASTDNDSLLVLDLSRPLEPQGCFTTQSGGASFSPSAICFSNHQMIRGDSRGYVFTHDPSYTTDPKVNAGVTPTSWSTQTIIWDYVGPATNFGTGMIRKWVPMVSLNALNESNLSLQINSINDDGKSTKALAPIRYRGNLIWGDATLVWGDTGMLWNVAGLIEEKRRFPAGGLRCMYKQIEITNALCIVTNSDTLGLGVANNVAKTLLLASAGTESWPADPIDYFISFQTDGFTKLYPVTLRTSDTLTLSDPDGSMPAGTMEWVLRGYPKGEVLHLNGFTVFYGLLTSTQASFTPAETGANA